MASIESTLNEIADMGSQNIVLGRPNEQEKAPGVDYFAKTAIGMATGGPGNDLSAEVCGSGGSWAEALENLKRQVAGLKKFEAKPSGVLIPGPKAGNGGRLKLS